LDDAIACFREALDRNPRNRDAVRTLAECLVETGERGKAVEVLNAFLEKEPLDKDLTALLESLGPEAFAVNTAS
jgi:thioredoxin-like negative regulator of GroEL